MKRQEFTRTTKLKAWDRAEGRCEECGRKLGPAEPAQYDHRIACDLGGDNSADNCVVLCRACHTAKTTGEDMPRIVRSRKARARHANADKTKRPLPGSKASGWKRRIDGTIERRH